MKLHFGRYFMTTPSKVNSVKRVCYRPKGLTGGLDLGFESTLLAPWNAEKLHMTNDAVGNAA